MLAAPSPSLLFSPGPNLAQIPPFKVHQHVVAYYLSKMTPITPHHELVSQLFLLFFFFLAEPLSLRILVPRPGIEPMSPAMEAWSPSHWTTRWWSLFLLYVPRPWQWQSCLSPPVPVLTRDAFSPPFPVSPSAQGWPWFLAPILLDPPGKRRPSGFSLASCPTLLTPR